MSQSSMSPSPTSKYEELRNSVTNRSWTDDRKEQLGMTPSTTKENATILYQSIKKGEMDINTLGKDVQQALKKFLDENGGVLEVPPGIDWTQYGIDPNAKTAKKEVAKKVEEQKQIALIQEKNAYTSQKTYHLDHYTLVGIGFICITLIVITYLILKYRQKQ